MQHSTLAPPLPNCRACTFGGGKVAAVATLVGRLQRYQHMQNLDMGLHKELDPGTSSALPSVWACLLSM
eukprot:24591-Pelagomonas_calceolata.AAC.1